MWDVAPDGGARPVVGAGVAHFVVDAQTGAGPRGREEVEADPGEDLVGRPGVGVGPVVELLVDPGEEAAGARGEAVAQGLRLRALDLVVAAAGRGEPVRAGQAGFFVGGVGRQGVVEGEGWRGGECWGVGGADVVDVAGWVGVLSACGRKGGCCVVFKADLCSVADTRGPLCE